MTQIVSHRLLSMGLGFGVCLAFVLHGQAQAQTPLQQCSAQYQAAKTANQLNGLSWNQFRAQCTSSQVAQANPLKPAAADTPPPPATAKPASKSSAATGEAKAASQGTAPVSNAVFPKAINPKYVNEKPGQQRSKTCLDQYNANKATNSNGGMKWIEKGGGYYSQCTNRLKA